MAQQLKIGQRIAQKQGWDVVGEYVDNDQSASQYARNTVREDWEKVVDLIKRGEVDILWVWEISRSTRDLEVWSPLLRVSREQGLHFGVDEDLYDTTKASHRRQLNQLIIDAVYESDKVHERVTRDLVEQAEQGRPHGRPHYAYTREYDPKTRALVRQVPHPERSKIVMEIVDRILVKKHTPVQVAADLNARGIPTPDGHYLGQAWKTRKGIVKVSKGWDHSTIQTLLSSPSLMGRRGYRGKIIEGGGWEALITAEEWHELQRILDPKVRGERRGQGGGARPGASTTLLSGLAVCDLCGALLYLNALKPPRATAYRCRGLGLGTKMHGQRKVDTLDEAVEAFVFVRMADPGVRRSFAPVSDGGKRTRAEARMVELEGELEELEEAVKAGQVKWQLANAAYERLEGELEEARAAAMPVVEDPLVDEWLSGPATLSAVKRIWGDWEIPQRRSVLRTLTQPAGIRMLRTGSIGRASLPPEKLVRMLWKGRGLGG